jgi:uncharacterized protein with PhoU and TrkA domain
VSTLDDALSPQAVSSEIATRFQELMEEEANDLYNEIINTAKLAIEAYEEGEKALGILVIKEALRITESYMELCERLKKGIERAYELAGGLDLIKKLMAEGARPDLLWSVYGEL